MTAKLKYKNESLFFLPSLSLSALGLKQYCTVYICKYTFFERPFTMLHSMNTVIAENPQKN